MNTEIHTVGIAVIAQTAIRYAAIFALVWLAFSFIDGWVMAYLSQP
ncbi:hypothetical protein [Phaeobacter gallaeciensis]|nr:hypothetical protein [Phaeobacter gallaeciensis]MDE4189621.1 hypothetical protein [Phaeobacter gallaeciensis]MDE4198773.1 hypothetical protein [Phaeobacter gallaeciensis]MDE4202918.1 hypothetical protein [Phaeobacter gallaeciensis]MDE4207062.1 hypothetical protein [Phaeobacter gallaeciensis]MDE4215713.1 hypothetical protein [Phaeobacter gallaeciensis]